jgi:hypothetical protein
MAYIDPADPLNKRDSTSRLTADLRIAMTTLTPPPLPPNSPEINNFGHSPVPANWHWRYPLASF